MYVVTRPGSGSWRWKIKALRSKENAVVDVFSPLQTFDCENRAYNSCEEFITSLADCLALPFEIITPSKKGQGEQGVGGQPATRRESEIEP